MPIATAVAQQAVRDSAGIRIFDYRTAPMPAPGFVVSERPVRAFQGGDLPDASVLGATALTTLVDGRWVVGIAVSQGVGRIATSPPVPPPRDSVRQTVGFAGFTRVRELRVYDSLGTFLSRGGTADSTVPGHFRGTIGSIHELPTGNLLVATVAGDLSQHRPDGAFERAVPIAPGDRLVGVFADGSMLLARARAETTPFIDGTLAGYRLHRHTTDYFRASADGRSLVSLPFVTEQPWYTRSALPLAGAIPTQVPLSPWPVTMPASAFTGRDVIWLFDRVKWELRVTDTQGRIQAVLRPPVPERVAKATLGEQFRTDSAYAETMLVDDAGRLWMDAGDNVRLSTADYSLRRWLVVDRKDGLLGSVIMPPGFRPLMVRGALVYGQQRATRFSAAVVAAYRVVPVRR